LLAFSKDLSCLKAGFSVTVCQADLAAEADEKNEGPDETESEEGPPEIATLPLERSMRILPHDQDTGGFFIAVFQKISPLKGIFFCLTAQLILVLSLFSSLAQSTIEVFNLQIWLIEFHGTYGCSCSTKQEWASETQACWKAFR